MMAGYIVEGQADVRKRDFKACWLSLQMDGQIEQETDVMINRLILCLFS